MRISSRNSRAPFVMVDKAVLMNESLTIYDKMVYSVLCAYASVTDRSCYPSYQTIARKASCSRRKVISVIAHLAGLGLIEKQERSNSLGDNTSNLYVVKTHAETQTDALDVPPFGADASPPGASQAPPNAKDAPEQDPNKNNQVKEIHPSIHCADEFDRLKGQIDYEYFEENFPERLGFIDSLLGYILELRREERLDIRRLLENVDSEVMLEFLEEMKGKSFQGVHNVGAYIKKIFAEFLREREVLMATAG